MRQNTKFLLAVGVIALAVTDASCGGKTCGLGTVAEGDECRAADDQVQCGPGFTVEGNLCVPQADWIKNYCDPKTAELRGGVCVGTGSATPCSGKCTTSPANGEICIEGQVVALESWVRGGADKVLALDKTAPLVLRAYDPVALGINPQQAEPLASTTIADGQGCFVFEHVKVPAYRLIALATQDTHPDVSNQTYVLAAMGIAVAEGANVHEVALPAASRAVVAGWGADVLTLGSTLLWFKQATGGIANVVPTINGRDPMQAGAQSVRFFDEGFSTFITTGQQTATTASGAVVITAGPSGMAYGGTKQGCNISPFMAGSIPGALYIIPLTVTGC